MTIAGRIAHRIRAIVIESTVPVITGELRKSIHVSKRGNGYIVGTNKIYARRVHDGSKKLIIRPRSKKALKWKGAKHPVKKVVQPAREGKPFFKDAIDKFLKNRDSEIRKLAPELKKDMRDLLIGSLKKTGVKITT